MFELELGLDDDYTLFFDLPTLDTSHQAFCSDLFLQRSIWHTLQLPEGPVILVQLLPSRDLALVLDRPRSP